MASKVLLYSGGLDSFIAAHLIPDAKLVYFDIGSVYSAKEVAALHLAPRQVTYDNRLRLGDMERDDAIIPARNLLLAAMGTFYGNEVLLAATAGDDQPRNTDKNAEFLKMTDELLAYICSGPRYKDQPTVSFKMPFIGWAKSQYVEAYLAKNLDPVALGQTVSCYHPTINNCGRCNPCGRKWIALQVNGCDTTKWECDPRIGYDWTDALAKIRAGGYRGSVEDNDILKVLGHT